eukprot:gnl/MRDRNA2_/MRDRNA2_106212_c0_seq1.p1 gnl/MRDRNA2_/MRDRNA2_106212_c0~~gnl/MRDRNA2_/MRDRNA2_106212_c0_seq1.p1  ORF type:complete len:299 (-),score=57.71 gnl/MRDRNA2_/MRDRNA2_106212_c0_seq1:38-934(-)
MILHITLPAFLVALPNHAQSSIEESIIEHFGYSDKLNNVAVLNKYSSPDDCTEVWGEGIEYYCESSRVAWEDRMKHDDAKCDEKCQSFIDKFVETCKAGDTIEYEYGGFHVTENYKNGWLQYKDWAQKKYPKCDFSKDYEQNGCDLAVMDLNYALQKDICLTTKTIIDKEKFKEPYDKECSEDCQELVRKVNEACAKQPTQFLFMTWMQQTKATDNIELYTTQWYDFNVSKMLWRGVGPCKSFLIFPDVTIPEDQESDDSGRMKKSDESGSTSPRSACNCHICAFPLMLVVAMSMLTY